MSPPTPNAVVIPIQPAMHKQLLILGILLSGALGCTPVHAQERAAVGVWLGVAAGPGWNTSHGAGARALGFSYKLTGGVALSSHVGLGAEVTRWATSLGSDTNATNVVAVGRVRPSPHPIFLTAGIGTAKATLVSPSSGALSGRKGVAFTAGFGLEIPIVAALHGGVSLDLLVQKFGTAGDLPTTNSLLVVTLGVLYRTSREN